MGTEDPPVGMELVNHHKSQVLKKGEPFGVVGQDRRMKHIRIGDDNVPLGADGSPGILGSISVIGVGSGPIRRPV